jgi:hypothetical protein
MLLVGALSIGGLWVSARELKACLFFFRNYVLDKRREELAAKLAASLVACRGA